MYRLLFCFPFCLCFPWFHGRWSVCFTCVRWEVISSIILVSQRFLFWISVVLFSFPYFSDVEWGITLFFGKRTEKSLKTLSTFYCSFLSHNYFFFSIFFETKQTVKYKRATDLWFCIVYCITFYGSMHQSWFKFGLPLARWIRKYETTAQNFVMRLLF